MSWWSVDQTLPVENGGDAKRLAAQRLMLSTRGR
jgi:hypothetical protein